MISTFLIIREGNKEMDMYKDILSIHKDIKEYSVVLEDILEDLDTLLDATLKKEEDLPLVQSESITKDINNSDKSSTTEITKIIEKKKHNEDDVSIISSMKEQGLNNSEIAKELDLQRIKHQVF